MKDNVEKFNWGYEIIWANKENYSGKILVFNKKTKTDFYMNTNTDKTWFINSGSFMIRWINTETGKIFQEQANEGAVFDCPRFKPCSLESLLDNGSITEVSNGIKDDKKIILSKENF